MRNSDTMRMKVGLLCLECDNRWETEVDAQDDETSVDIHTFCEVCDGEDVIVEYVDHPELGRIDTGLANEEAEEVIDTFNYHCPQCNNTYFLTANVPNRCPYCKDMGILERVYTWLKDRLGVKVNAIGTVALGRKKGEG